MTRARLPATEEPSEVSVAFRSIFPEEHTDFRVKAWKSPSAGFKPLYPTALHALAAAAKKAPRLGITLLPEVEGDATQFLSYASLWEDARRLAATLMAGGVKRGDRVLLVLPTSLEFVKCFFAVQMARAIPVPAYPPAALEKLEIGLDRLRHLGSDAGVTSCITNNALRPVLGQLVSGVASLENLWSVETLEARTKHSLASVRARATDTAFLQYTSGSTGNPKGVELTHGAVMANVHGSGVAGRIEPTDVTVSWLPLYHDMGLVSGLLMPIYWRTPLVLMSPMAFLMEPRRWLAAITEHKGTVSAAPNFAYSMCVKRVRPADRKGLDLSSWRVALNGAERVNHRTLVDFEATFGPHGFGSGTFFPAYGLAESTVTVTFPSRGEPFHTRLVNRAKLAEGIVEPATGPASVALVACGKPIPGHDVQVLDDKGKPVPLGTVGHIVVRGPSLMKGYWGKPDVTERVLRNGALWTGDLGFWADEGLYITGRAKDLIIVRGKNYYAEDVERVAERVPGTRPSGVVAFAVYDSDRAVDLVVLVVETREIDPKIRATMVAGLGERVQDFAGVRVDEVVLVEPGTLPKTSSGKKQRSLCRERYLNQTLSVQRTGALKAAWIFARSTAGLVAMAARKRWRRAVPPSDGTE